RLEGEWRIIAAGQRQSKPRGSKTAHTEWRSTIGNERGVIPAKAGIHGRRKSLDPRLTSHPAVEKRLAGMTSKSHSAGVRERSHIDGRAPVSILRVALLDAGQQLHGELLGQLLGALAAAEQVDIRRLGPLIRRVDAGEVADLAGARLAVETLRVAPFALLQRRVDKHLEELAGVEQLAGRAPLAAV